MKKRIIIILIILLLISGAILYYFLFNKENNVNENNITIEDNILNIYFFYGDGCPHCEKEKEFFKSIEEQYKDKFKIYMFETWNDKNNVKLLDKVAKVLGDTITGVPYTVIGSTSIIGYSESMKDDFIAAIENEKNNISIYDVIKKNAS